MALDVNNVVSVTVNISPKAASTRGFGQCLIIGTSNVIPKEERIRYYSSLTELGKMLDNPISKSGVNHRMKAIQKKAEEIRKSQI